MKKIKLSLLDYQAEFLKKQQEALYCAFVGGVGSGKSYTLAISAFLDSLHSPEAIIGVYGPTVGHVRDICMAYIIKLMQDNGFIKDKDFDVNKNEMKIISKHPQIGSFVFKSMHDPADIIGYQTYTAHVDELDTMDSNKAEAAWYAVLARTRQWPGNLAQEDMKWDEESQQYEPRNKVCAYTTPEGFRFAYKMWGRNNEGSKDYDPEYQIVKGKTKENPFNASDYYKNMLKKYPGPLAEAYLEGEFVNLQSGTVYYAFDRQAHDSKEEIRPGEELHIGMDFNVGNMCSAIFVARAGGKEWHQVDELYGLLDVPDMVEEIQKYQRKGHRIYVYPDASSKRRVAENASNTQLAQLKAAKFIIRKQKNNPLVVDRVACTNRAFSNGQVFVNVDRCPHSVECREQQAYDKSNKPEKGTGFDDMNDAADYFIFNKLNIRPTLKLLDFSFAQRA